MPPIDVTLMIEPPPCVLHVPGGVAGARHNGQQVDRHDFMEIREVIVEKPEVHRARHPCVVDHDVQAPETVNGRRHETAHLVHVGHVGLDELRVGADVRRKGGPAVTVDVGDQHLGALGGEPARQAFAETRRAAGDDRDLACQFVCHAAPFTPKRTFRSESTSKSRQNVDLGVMWTRPGARPGKSEAGR